jgi:hypothetical protein
LLQLIDINLSPAIVNSILSRKQYFKMPSQKAPQVSQPSSQNKTRPPTNIIRLSLTYFIVVFLTGFILGGIRQGFLIPTFHLARSKAELIEMPFMVLSTILWARWLVRRYQVPAIVKTRVAVGGLAMGILVVIELLGEFFVSARWDTEGDKGYWIGKGAFTVAVMLFGTMPWILMVVGY